LGKTGLAKSAKSDAINNGLNILGNLSLKMPRFSPNHATLETKTRDANGERQSYAGAGSLRTPSRLSGSLSFVV
jgi:hypothetical protein